NLFARCLCPAGYSGEKCTEEDQCYFSYAACENWGTCVNANTTTTGFKCECYPGYVGELCETYSACSSLPCTGESSTCVDVSYGVYECTCGSGWQGEHCDQDIDECAEADMIQEV
ncbi:hypothetical protein PMAYCL1PPCAC_13681, partial [Pristionchus mayeri]